LLMIASSINPEIAGVAIFTLAIYVLISGLKDKSPKLSFAVWMGVITAAAMLSKLTAIILIPVVVMSFALLIKCSWKRTIRLSALYLFSAFVLLAPWLVINQVHYHRFLPNNVVLFDYKPLSPNWPNVVFMVLNDFRDALNNLAGNFGWLDAPVFFELRLIYIIVSTIFIGLGIWFLITKTDTFRWKDRVEFVSMLCLTFLVIFLVAFSLEMAKYNWITAMQPRYFLICLLPATILFYAGVSRVIKPKNPDSIARVLFAASLLLFLTSILYTLLPRYYV
jgi:uncharacterized membrane protein YozB (DUF420 family)